MGMVNNIKKTQIKMMKKVTTVHENGKVLKMALCLAITSAPTQIQL